MPINISYEPIGAVGDLAYQAGRAEAQSRLDLIAQQHYARMSEIERQAEIESQAKYREQQFQQAMASDQFNRGRLTLQETYGYNMALAR